MLKPWTIVITVHAVVATLAIALGAFNLIRKIKGDPIHKFVGRTWSALMLITSVSAFFIGGYNDLTSVLLHALAAWTIISIVSGVYFAKKGNIAAHRGFMTGSYFGLIGALIGVLVVPTRRIPTWFDAYPIAMSCIACFILLLAWIYIFLVTRRYNRVAKKF